MFSLVYRSIISSSLDFNSLIEMLHRARVFNKSKGITGCLLYHNGKIVQLLEGNEAEVKSLFERIKNDSRHKNIVVLNTEETLFRMFGDWSMIYENKANNQASKRKLFENIYHSSKATCLPSISKLSLWTEVNFILDKPKPVLELS